MVKSFDSKLFLEYYLGWPRIDLGFFYLIPMQSRKVDNKPPFCLKFVVATCTNNTFVTATRLWMKVLAYGLPTSHQ